ncbi:TolC family protein [Rikenella microfusus]|uniref:TolC family protein n=1 Tax=Rikenella microfusus TaxID=28139 RepID=UPI001DB56BE8|nr:TolC family protein [Rikenella microfusus]HJE88492.1 TolC family protein [Rikenella microfusus]
MKVRILSACFILLSSAACRTAGGGEVWNIERCIRHAVEHNLQVRQGLNTVETARVENAQSKLDYLPDLNAGLGYNVSFGRSLDPTTYNYVSGQTVQNASGSLSLSTTVFAGMQKLHNLRRAEFSLMASVQDVERIKDEIAVSVAGAYLQVLYNKEQVAVSKAQIETLESQIERTSRLVEAGSLPIGDRLELEAQLASERYNLVNYENQRVNALLTLTQLLELRDVPGFDVEVPDSAALAAAMDGHDLRSVGEIYGVALEMPRIEVTKWQRRMAEQDVSLARARYYPSLSFGASYGSSWSDARQRPQLGPDGKPYYTNYPFFDQLGDNASSALQFSMSVPIFGGLTARNSVRKTKIALRNADLAVKLAEDQLYKEIQQAWTDASGALERYRSARSSVVSNAESFRNTEQKFNAGAATAVDYNVAKNNLLAAQSLMLQARYEYIFKMKILDFYRGVEITL